MKLHYYFDSEIEDGNVATHEIERDAVVSCKAARCTACGLTLNAAAPF